MPAPAVIPAPKAYINAVAVKGFVVELGAAKRPSPSQLFEFGALALAAREHPKQKFAGATTYPPTHAHHVRRRTPAIITVTKKARLKQSIDMNWKAWDNNAAACGLPSRLLLALNVCGRLWIRTTSGSGFRPHASADSVCLRAPAAACGVQE